MTISSLFISCALMQMSGLGLGFGGALSAWEPCSALDMTHKLCTPLSHMTWHLGSTSSNGSRVAVPFFTRETACASMSKKGYSRIDLHGDSFMRHLTQALLLIFSGDYDAGSLNSHAKAIVECQGDAQFSEKGCSVNGSLVNEPVRQSVSAEEEPLCHFMGHRVDLSYSGSESFQCGGGNGTIQLFSSGNHAQVDGQSWSINNATASMGNFFATHTCAPETQKCISGFVSTHHRIAVFPDGYQRYVDVKNFNLGMRAYIEGGACGPRFSYIDTFNFTEALVLTFARNETNTMTHDGVHWSRTVNLLKAQLVLHHFLSSS